MALDVATTIVDLAAGQVREREEQARAASERYMRFDACILVEVPVPDGDDGEMNAHGFDTWAPPVRMHKTPEGAWRAKHCNIALDV